MFFFSFLKLLSQNKDCKYKNNQSLHNLIQYIETEQCTYNQNYFSTIIKHKKTKYIIISEIKSNLWRIYNVSTKLTCPGLMCVIINYLFLNGKKTNYNYVSVIPYF